MRPCQRLGTQAHVHATAARRLSSPHFIRACIRRRRLRKKMQAARNLQERAVRLREKACSDQRKAPPERG